MEAAEHIGTALAKLGIGLVYGGGSVGLMGATAHAALKAGGHVTGIIPDFLMRQEVMLNDVQDLIVTKGMHERKTLMFEKADAFIALPGGIGTLEETVEMMTWRQLGQHHTPIVLANIDGFWAPLIALIEHMRAHAFIAADRDVEFSVVDQAEAVVPALLDRADRLTEAQPASRAGAPALSNL